MNKIKFKLASSKLFDEIAIVNIKLDEIVLASNLTLTENFVEYIYNVEGFSEFSTISIELINNENDDENIIANLKIVSSNFQEEFINYDDLSLLVLIDTIEISKDNGTTWKNVTIGSENNPQGILFAEKDGNDLILHGRIDYKEVGPNGDFGGKGELFHLSCFCKISKEDGSFPSHQLLATTKYNETFYSEDTNKLCIKNKLYDFQNYQIIKRSKTHVNIDNVESYNVRGLTYVAIVDPSLMPTENLPELFKFEPTQRLINFFTE